MSEASTALAIREAAARGHRPVLLNEVMAVLDPRPGEIFVDGTFGAGGYSQALLEAADCKVWGIDRDPSAIAAGRTLAARYGERLTLVEGRFGDMENLLPDELGGRVDGISLDLGLSSMQIDQPERGFSFQHDAELSMRMSGDQDDSGPSAAEVVMTMGEQDLADILYRYGEERQSRHIARAIVAARAEKPIERTGQLAAIVRAVITRRQGKPKGRGLDPATRTFQALRIYVNNELGELERGLEAAERLLAPGGRLAVVAFHSLESGITKAFLRQRSGQDPRPSRHQPQHPSPCQLKGGGRDATFTLLFRGAKKPSDSEIASNPRARSASLRAARRTDHPAQARGPGAGPAARV